MNLTIRKITTLILCFNIAVLALVSCNETREKALTKKPEPSEKSTPSEDTTPKTATNLKKPDSSLKGPQRCVACHEKEVKDWQGSHHDKAMAVATAESVKGNFKDAVFDHKGRKTKFFMKGKEYFVSTPNSKGEQQEFKITHTFGIAPLQQYIVEFPGGRKQCLHVAWDDVKKQWYHLYGNMDIADDEWLNWTGGSQNWNSMCADCHSTELKKNFDPETDTYHTTFKNINVTCEACHGPSDQHILNYMNPEAKLGNGELFISLKKDKTPVNQSEIQKCARCHSRRSQLTEYYDHSGTYMDHYLPEILRDGIYHKDGQILDEVYVYGSFAQSKMYHNNVRCSDCHNPHSNKLKFEGNALCMQCHGKTPEKAFDSPAHHFHKMGTDGAKCVNCHMAGKHYMGIDFRRDHSFRIPRPDQTVKYGTPNACNDCHKDKTAQWAADAIEKVHGKERKLHFSDMLVPGKDRYKPDFESLKKLALDTTQPAIARATAIWELQPIQRNDIFSIAHKLLSDKEPLVRHHAIGVFSQLPTTQKITILSPLLIDSNRAVRVQAAHDLMDANEADLEPKFHEAFKKARKELKVWMDMHADSAGGQLNLSNFHSSNGKKDLAKNALQRALKIDYRFSMARMNLAFMLSIEEKYDEAEKEYKQILEYEPQYSQAWYNLGLLYAEQNKFELAVDAFTNAIAREPDNLRIYYNKALTLQNLKLYDEAEKTFIEGLLRKIPVNQNTADLLYGLIMLQLETKQMEKATEAIGQFVQIFGQQHPYMRSISQKMGELQKSMQR